MTGLDWPGLMRAGLGRLRLQPRVFWDLTPAELQLMLGATGKPLGLTRPQLDQLMRRFPDAPSRQTDKG